MIEVGLKIGMSDFPIGGPLTGGVSEQEKECFGRKLFPPKRPV